jgi:hypothetical protein
MPRCRPSGTQYRVIGLPGGNNSFTRSLACSQGDTRLDMLDEHVPTFYQITRCRYRTT